MFKKVIKITEENKLQLMGQYDFEEEMADELVGYYLVADFGDGHECSFLDQIVLDQLFMFTGKVLDNGYVEYEVRRF